MLSEVLVAGALSCTVAPRTNQGCAVGREAAERGGLGMKAADLNVVPERPHGVCVWQLLTWYRLVGGGQVTASMSRALPPTRRR